MSLSATFNDGYAATKANANVLAVRYSVSGYETILAFDFAAHVLITRTNGYGDGGAVVTPFSQLDRNTLIVFRDKLVELGGNPPELVSEASHVPLDKKFRL